MRQKQDVELMKQLAINEATKLKELLTNEEKLNLNKQILDPNSQWDCIYGMACEGCNSPRAIELIHQCAEKVYVNNAEKYKTFDDYGSTLLFDLNGEPKDVVIGENKRSNYYYSPIEIIITRTYLGEEAGFKIIDFLRGETQTLEL